MSHEQNGKKIARRRKRSLSLSMAELVCRMVEAATGEERPKQMTAEQALMRMLDQRSRDQYSAVADAAVLYLTEWVDDATQLGVAGEMVTLH